jgi:WhiB family redox-sensing transcriptional regulator
VEGAAQRSAREVCVSCPVRIDCLIDALDHRILFGVWGGMTERERRALLRRYPDVASWRDIVEADPELVSWPGVYRVARGRRALARQEAGGR